MAHVIKPKRSETASSVPQSSDLETHEIAIKIARPITRQFKDSNFNSFTSDCSLAAHHIENTLGNLQEPEHPISLIKKAYGIKS